MHTWSGDYQQQDPLAEKFAAENWNYIFPNFRGANRTPEACLSDAALSDLEDALDFAIKLGNVDRDRIFVVGVSGGGYAALGMYLRSKHPVHTYFSWVPISDLESWYWQSKNRANKYAQDILDCLDAGALLDVDFARDRSPLYWEDHSHPAAQLEIFAGVNDGYQGSVPISHSLRFFNKLAQERGFSDALIPAEDQVQLLTRGYSIYPERGTIENRAILYSRSIPGVGLTIFEGNHEMLTEYSFQRLLELAGN